MEALNTESEQITHLLTYLKATYLFANISYGDCCMVKVRVLRIICQMHAFEKQFV